MESDAIIQAEISQTLSAALCSLMEILLRMSSHLEGCNYHAGLATQPEGASLLQKLLSNTMRLQIYRERSEWVHHLYELHVKPALVLQFHASRPVVPAEER